MLWLQVDQRRMWDTIGIKSKVGKNLCPYVYSISLSVIYSTVFDCVVV